MTEIRKYILTILVATAVSTAFAQDSSSSSSSFLDQVVVTAQKQARTGFFLPYSAGSRPASGFMEEGIRTVPEALWNMPGSFLQKTNHGGGSVFLRGLTGNQTLILVDGVRLNNSIFRYGPNQYLNTIDPYSVQRIEVVRGTGSVQFGTDALGGVIHVLTREPSFSSRTWKGWATGKYVTGGVEKTAHAGVEYGSAKTAFLAQGSYRDFGHLVGGDTTGTQSPSGYREYSFDARARFRLSQQAELLLAHQFLQQDDVPVYHKVRLENFRINEMDVQRRLLHYARLTFSPGRKYFRKMELTASWQQSLEKREMSKNGSATTTFERDQVSTAGLTLDLVSEFSSAWSANSGIELYLDKVRSGRSTLSATDFKAQRGLYPDHSHSGNYSVYSLHHVQLGRWNGEFGLRYNIFDIRITDTGLGKVKIHPSALVSNASLLYTLSSKHNIYFSFSSGYRAPNIDDMGTLGIVDFRYELPQSELSPERSFHYELGYKFRSAKWSAALALYRMRLQSLITRVRVPGETRAGYPVYRKENTESALVQGGEAEVEGRILRHLRMQAHVSYTWGRNETKNEPLRRIPPLNGRWSLRYGKGKVYGTAELLFALDQGRLAQGDKDDNRIPAGGTPGWEVFNLYAGATFGNLQLRAGLQNVFNQDYRLHGSGINGAGRQVFITSSINF